MAQMMMQVPSDLVRTFAIPDEVVREAYRDNPDHARATVESLRKVRRLARELGLVNPVSKRLWQRLGIWDDDDARAIRTTSLASCRISQLPARSAR